MHNIFILHVLVTKKTRCRKKKKEEKDTVDAKNVNFKYLIIYRYHFTTNKSFVYLNGKWK